MTIKIREIRRSMKGVLRWGFVLFLSAALWGQAEPAKATAQRGGKATASRKAKRQPPASAEEVATLRQAVDAQQQRIQQLESELKAALQQIQQQVTTLQSGAAQTTSLAQAASTASQENASKLASLQNNVATLTTAEANTTTLLQKDEKRVAALEQPATLHYKGISFTPGGFVQASTVFRVHNTNSDTAESFGAVPLSGSANSHLSEFRFSARASRISLRADATVGSVKTMGYAEMDFLGAASTANEIQKNGFNPRLRLAFANVDLPRDLSVSAGQNWSLLQLTRKGIAPLAEFLPVVIDNNQFVGFTNARQSSVRVVKGLGKRAWAGFALENPETVVNVQCVNGVPATPCSGNVTGLGNIQGLETSTNATSPNNGFSNPPNPSTDQAPDLIAKVAFEPGWGHYEFKAMGRFFRDRVYPNFSATTSSQAGATNKTTEGGALGFGMVLPVVKDKVDFIFQAIGGRGIGRYGAAGGPDVTVRPDGALVAVPGYQALAGFETHPTPKFDFYVYGGDEYYGRVEYKSATALFGAPSTTAKAPVVVGYGSSLFFDGGCNLEFPAASAPTSQLCQSAAQNRNVWTVNPGFWYRLFKGKEGTLQYGMSYAYIYRKPWAGIGGNPTGIGNTILTSFRFSLP
jgi:hypothetical protein